MEASRDEQDPNGATNTVAPLSAKEKIAGARLPERTVEVCLRADLVDEFVALEGALAQAQATAKNDPRLNAGGETRRIAEEMETLRTQMRDSSIEVLLRARNRKAWDQMLKRHPARPGVEEDTLAGHNVETFFDAAIRACWVEPSDLDQAEITDLLDERVTPAQYNELVNAVLGLNVRRVSVPFSPRASQALRETSPG